MPISSFTDCINQINTSKPIRIGTITTGYSFKIPADNNLRNGLAAMDSALPLSGVLIVGMLSGVYIGTSGTFFQSSVPNNNTLTDLKAIAGPSGRYTVRFDDLKFYTT